MEAYMKAWELDGASLAIMRDDSLVYARGYGFSAIDSSAGPTADSSLIRPGTLMRLASVSKLLTATGIMLLCERDSLSLDSPVFGPDGLLSELAVRDPSYYGITVRHLLTHSSGLSCRAGGDPLFPGVYVGSRETVLKSLRRRLAFRPGEASEYSNLGYLLLSMIIERVSGQSYEAWMQENVLHPAGCRDFHIGGNTPEARLPGESVYGNYSVNNFRLLSGAGAWVASAPELARFVASIDGRPGVPDIISERTVEEMTFPTDSVTYAIGWNDIKPDGEWTRTGTLSSTTALVKYYPDGECWIFISNCGSWKGPRFSRYTSSLFRRLRERYSAALPKRDLFWEEP
ncbi:MAG: beta-lactamase family protein [Bacteroidales bacterium]|nr:beta-lactamase family protein [Bacteroidales bacterium]